MKLGDIVELATKGSRRVPVDDSNIVRFSRIEFLRIFISKWLIRDGATVDCSTIDPSAYSGLWYFVFQRNFDVTNIAYEELKCLVNRYTHCSNDVSVRSTILDFSTYLHVIGGAIGDEKLFNSDYLTDDYDADIATFVSNFLLTYSSLVEHCVVLETFHNSCLIYLPPSLTLNCMRVLADSGYIYCGGVPIYVRNSAKCSSTEIETKFSSFLGKDSGQRPIFVAPVAEEFNLEEEGRGVPISYKNGLDGMRIKMRKHYVEGVTLFESLSNIGTKFSSEIALASGMNFLAEEMRTLDNDETLDNDDVRAIWIHADYSIEYDTTVQKYSKGREQFIFIYLQIVKNTNPLLAFKERKPAWVAPITLPHTLSSAMLNVATNSIEILENFAFLDPFAGTGTTLIDAALRHPKATVIGFDRNPAFYRMVEDNFAFLRMAPANIDTIRDRLLGLILEFGDGYEFGKFSWDTKLNELDNLRGGDFVRAVLSSIFQASGMGNFSSLEASDVMVRLNELKEKGFPEQIFLFLENGSNSLEDRIIVYLIWRAILSNIYAISVSRDSLVRSLVSEFRKSALEYSYLSSKYSLHRSTQEADLSGFCLTRGTFSDQILFTFSQVREIPLTRHERIESVLKAIHENAPGVHLLRVEDSLQACTHLSRAIDVIVCDPPYGFNTREGGISAMRDFFKQLMPSLFGALNDTGRIVSAVAETARNGRSIPFYQTSEYLDQSVRRYCAGQGISISTDESSGSASDQRRNRNIYWASSSALDRRILNYKIAR